MSSLKLHPTLSMNVIFVTYTEHVLYSSLPVTQRQKEEVDVYGVIFLKIAQEREWYYYLLPLLRLLHLFLVFSFFSFLLFFFISVFLLSIKLSFSTSLLLLFSSSSSPSSFSLYFSCHFLSHSFFYIFHVILLFIFVSFFFISFVCVVTCNMVYSWPESSMCLCCTETARHHIQQPSESEFPTPLRIQRS